MVDKVVLLSLLHFSGQLTQFSLACLVDLCQVPGHLAPVPKLGSENYRTKSTELEALHGEGTHRIRKGVRRVQVRREACC